MEIIIGDERHRRWSVQEKLRIVAETEQPGGGIADVARRHRISRGLLWNWRSQVRRGVLKPEVPPVFLPVQAIGEMANGSNRTPVSSPVASAADPAAAPGQVEITLPDGISVKVGQDVGLVTRRRVMAVLRR
jgi:transposase